MRSALLLLLILCLPAAARAEWADVPVETLVRESDIIVVGTLRDVTEHRAGEVDYGQGYIDVREVMLGRVSPGDSLLLKWDNATALACPRVEHRYHAGGLAIWLLKPEGEAVRADYPGRFVELSRRRQVEKALTRSPVVLRGSAYWVKPGEPLTFSIVYHNVTDAPRTFPGTSFEGGRLLLAPGSRLGVKTALNSRERRAALAGRVVADGQLAPVTVGPRGEHRVEVDLRALLATEPVEGESFDVTLSLAGLPETNGVRFHVGLPPFFPLPEAPPATAQAEKKVYVFAAPAAHRDGLTPLKRAGLAGLFAFALFPFFYRLRAALAGARLARVAQGAQTWQI